MGNHQAHPIPDELLAVLGSLSECERAVEVFMKATGVERDAAIGHLVGLVERKGQLNASYDGGLAEQFPKLAHAYLGDLHPIEEEKTVE